MTTQNHSFAATTQAVKGEDSRDAVITRVFNAPRERVYQAWTSPALFSHWWGPHNFTNPVCKLDVRPGGEWRIVMRSPEGVEYPIKGTYHEVEAPERLVFTDNWEEHPADWKAFLKKSLPVGATMNSTEALNMVTFEERNGKTILTIRTRFENPAVCDAMLAMGMGDGWGQSFDRLDSLLEEIPA